MITSKRICKGKLTSEMVKKYVEDVAVDEGIVEIHARFYNSYDENKESQGDSDLQYEVQRLIFS